MADEGNIENPAGSPNEADRIVGQRVRTFRLQAGLSQTALGDAIGVTFQQIQKYEVGGNRIAVSRLVDIAQALNVPLGSFLDFATPIGGVAADTLRIGEVLSTPEGERLVIAFNAIRTLKVRRRVVKLVEAMSDSDDTNGA